MVVFSIVVPVYKVEPYLDKCVGSLIDQTYRDLEILLVDDGSPDGCPAMCDAYAERDERIRVIHKENGGLSDARNVGIEAATGEYIVFVDSDDFISLDALESFLPYTRRNCDILIADGVSEGARKKLSHGYTSEVCRGEQYLKIALEHGSMPMAAWLYVYNRKFLLQNQLQFHLGITHEDEEFTPRAFLAAQRVIETGVCFYHYMVREGSITTARDLRKNGRDLYATCLKLKERYDALPDARLRMLLQDSLVIKLLSLAQLGRLYQYGKEYVYKSFVRKNAYRRKTRLKAWLYCLSPRLYWHINNLTKMREKR